MKYCSIIPIEVKNGTIDFRTNPIGTGPFYFKKWIPKEKLVFRKNQLYFEKDSLGNQLPYLEAVSITFLPDKQSEFLQFIQGKLDFINGLDISYKDELLDSNGDLRDKYKPKIKLDKTIQLNTEYIGFNLSNSKFEGNSEFFRKAINYGIDKAKMVKYLRNGVGTGANHGFVPPSLVGDNKLKGFYYDPKLAKGYLDKYMTESQTENPSLTISTNPSYVDLIELIQSDLKKIGIDVIIDVMPASTLRQKRSNGDLEAFRASWIADYPDAENYLSLFYSKNKSPLGPNYTFFESKHYDSLYVAALKANDNSNRLNNYKQLDSLIIDKAVVIPLLYDEVIRFNSKSLKNFSTNAINLLELKEVYKLD
jgi:peptide/nickel transport system substrate-binding protein